MGSSLRPNAENPDDFWLPGLTRPTLLLELSPSASCKVPLHYLTRFLPKSAPPHHTMSFPIRALSILAVAVTLVSFAPRTEAATLVYPRSQTLGGWNERVFTSTWTDLEPDVKNRISTDVNGDLRGFSAPTHTTWLTSPTFVLEAGEISIASIYLIGGADSAPTSVAGISAEKSASGWGGIGLRDSLGNFVLTYSATTIWQPVTFTAEALAPYVGQTLRLDFISMNHNSDFLYVNRPISLEGTLTSIPEASTFFQIAGLLSCGLAFRRRA